MPPGSSSTVDGMYQWMVFDEDGCETQLRGWPGFLGEYVEKRYIPLALHVYPRWGRAWGLRLYGDQVNGAAKPVIEFRMPQIGQGRRSASAIPAPRLTARDGDVEFELRRFATGCSTRSAAVPPEYGDPIERATHLEIAAKQNGQPTTDWMPVSFRLSDDTGNVLDAGEFANPVQVGNVTRLSLWQNLFAEQRSWWVRAEVARTRSATFRPEEIAVLRNVPTPSRSDPPGVSRWFDAPRALTANGMSLACRGISWSSMGPPYAEVKLELKGKPLAGTRVTVLKAIDDSGRALPLDGEWRIIDFNRSGTPLVRYELPLTIRKPMKTVDLTVAVQRTRFVEFQASPTRPTGPAPTSLQAVTSR